MRGLHIFFTAAIALIMIGAVVLLNKIMGNDLNNDNEEERNQ